MTAATQETAAAELNWIPAEKEYSVAISDGKLVCRNPKGAQLASLPKWLKESDVTAQVKGLVEWLSEHEQECRNTSELWMLRSLPVPQSVLAAVWPDPAWASVLENLVVCPVDKTGKPDQKQAGFLRGVDAKKGVGIVDLDGETQWLKAGQILIPHPILLLELDDFRDLATELAFQQSIDQLFLQTLMPDKNGLSATAINEFARGKFEALSHVLGLCRRLGYRVSGGNATCTVWEGGRPVEARYWVGADDPQSEAWTGDLHFTDDRDRALAIKDVGPVAYSEGMRMSAAIYARRVVKTDDE